MTAAREFPLTLNAFDEPALVVAADGAIVAANRAAEHWFGRPLPGLSLAELDGEGRAGRFLLRASRTTSPLVGALHLARPDARPERIRCYGKLLRPAAGASPALVLVRFARDIDVRFRALTNQIRDLNDEIRRHLHTQLLLKRAVSERELLLRELNHRVMNNMQMLSALLSAAQREAVSEQARTVLADAGQRIAAIAAAQRVLYRSDDLRRIDSRQLVDAVCCHIRDIAGRTVDIDIDAERLELDNDVAAPLALILSELLMNAIKHGVIDGGGDRIAVGLERQDGGFVLRVEDNGPGFALAEPHKRASGLGLVRGLVAQLGGAFSVGHSSGASCVVSINRSSTTPGETA